MLPPRRCALFSSDDHRSSSKCAASHPPGPTLLRNMAKKPTEMQTVAAAWISAWLVMAATRVVPSLGRKRTAACTGGDSQSETSACEALPPQLHQNQSLLSILSSP
jgi:hypothetical protein